MQSSETMSKLVGRSSTQATVGPFPGGGGGTWVFRGVHTFVIKIKKYPKALISGQKSTLILIKR